MNMIGSKDIKEMLNSEECFLYGDYSVVVNIDECSFMDCYVSVINCETQTEEKIFFNECVKKVTDIFGKKFCETMAEKINEKINKK